MKKILVVSQYFYPEQFRINDICKELIDDGYDVTVLTGIPNYPKGKFYSGYGLFKKRKETVDGINIIRMPIISRGNNAIKLSLNYLSFLISGSLWAFFTRKVYDSVFIYEVSPMTQAIPGVLYAKKRKIKSHIYVMDLWPENFVSMSGVKNKFIINRITNMVKYIYNNVSTILVSSPQFTDNIKQLGNYEDKIKYWPQYAEDFYEPTDEKSIEILFDTDKFNITFAGNIGYAQGLSVLPKTVEKLINDGVNNISINLIGDGRYKEELMKEAKSKNLDNFIKFYNPVPANEIPKIMSQTDAALISLSKDPIYSLTIPAKFQSIIAMGVPIVVASDGVLEDIIKNNNIGVWGPSEDEDALYRNIKYISSIDKEQIKSMSINALTLSNEKFNKLSLLKDLEDILEEK